ncbi:unnamed protein product, partial [Effrenium voratum]
MGGVHPTCLSKDQLLSDIAHEAAEAAEEWLGKGALAQRRFAQDGEARLPAALQEFLSSELQLCSRLGKLASDELSGTGSARGREVAGPFQVLFAEDDPECLAFEALLAEAASAEVAPNGAARSESDARNVARLLLGFAPGKPGFVLSLRVELASIAFKRGCSPFRSAAFVEPAAQQAAKDLESQAKVLKFVSSYGNCVVEKAFFGGVLCLCFQRKGGPSSLDESFQVELGRDVYGVSKQQRGGGQMKLGDTKKPLNTEQLEKMLRGWCKSCAKESKGQTVVRLKLAPSSKLEGLPLPAEVLQLDLRRKVDLEKAAAELKRAERARSLPQLCEALDRALACHLDDPQVEELQEKRLRLTDAQKALQTRDPTRLRCALQEAEEAGLPEWSRETYEQTVQLQQQLLEQRHSSRLRSAVSSEVRLIDLVEILCSAAQDGCAMPELEEAETKLVSQVGQLTREASDMSEARATELEEALAPLDRAERLDRARLAASRFREAAAELRRACAERRRVDERRRTLERSLTQLVDDVDGSDEEHAERFEELRSALQETAGLPAEAQQSLRPLQTRGQNLLEEKRTMEETAQQLQTKLREATLATSQPEMLEAVLQEVARKHQSGALHRAKVSKQLLDSGRRQLQSMLQHELEEQLRKVAAPGAVQSGGVEAMEEAKSLLRRMEDACQPSCAAEVRQSAEELQSAKRGFEEKLQRHKKQVEAKEKLKEAHVDPDCLESSMREAQDHGVEEEHLLPAQARLRELRTAERQVQSALERGDRVHLTAALEEAGKQGLKTPAVDEAMQKLQSSKTGALVSAIRDRDYHGLRQAIADAESRRPEEVAEVADVISQAKDVHKTLDAVAKSVSAALRTMSYGELCSSVAEAAQHHIATEDVKKAEGVLGTMNEALEKLQAASNAPTDLAALQESLHEARQLGLQKHPVYQKSAELFSET